MVADAESSAAWEAWLRALATDAEAAVAAALAYDSLDGGARDAWLDALEEDVARVGVPVIAVYAPLLSVEREPARVARIQAALGDASDAPGPVEARALRGVAEDGTRVTVLVLPLYLSFVQLFACRYSTHDGFVWARHDPFARDGDAPRAGSRWEGVLLERTPMKPVVEELAHAVLAQKRRGDPAPAALKVIVDLFSPELGSPEGDPS